MNGPQIFVSQNILRQYTEQLGAWISHYQSVTQTYNTYVCGL